MIKRIPKNKLPHCKHDRFCMETEAKSKLLFAKVCSLILTDIKKALKVEKLTKSEDIGPGWTGEVPLIKLDLEKVLGSVLDKYIFALEYMMLGVYAGKKAKEAAVAIGVEKMLPPGFIFGTFLHGVDMQRAYYEMITGTKAPTLDKDILKGAFDAIQGKTARMIEDSLGRFRNRLLDVVDLMISTTNNSNISKVLENIHENQGNLEDGTDTVADVASRTETEKIGKKVLGSELGEVIEKGAEDFERLVETTSAMATSTGTHIAVNELFGSTDSEMKAALVNLQNPRCCDKCTEFARNSDGSLRLYPLSAFKPSGWNYGKKKSEWKLTIPGIHPRCRCVMVHVPKNWAIEDDGTIVQNKSK